jgi:integrase
MVGSKQPSEALQGFRDWLIDEEGLSHRTAATYCRCVRASKKRNQLLAVIRDPQSPRSTRTLYRAALIRWATFQEDEPLLGILKSPKMSREVRSGSKKLMRKVRPIPPEQMKQFILMLNALREMEDVPDWVWPSLSLLRKLALRAGVDLCQVRREAVVEALATGVLQIWTKGERVREVPTRQVQEELLGLLNLGEDWEMLADKISPNSRIACRLDSAYKQVSSYLKAVAGAAGIDPKEVHSHRFRHTRALELYRKTKDVRLVQKFLGHRSLETTQHYLQVSLTEIDDHMDDME